MSTQKNLDMVGARNPYALAEYKLGRKINWQEKSPLTRQILLEKSLKSSYEKLFSPSHNSPLYRDYKHSRKAERS